MKKVTFSLAVLLSGFVVNSYAAIPFNHSNLNVSIPVFNGGLTFGLAGLYLKPTTSELDYAVTYPAIDNTDNGRYQSVNADFDWGYKASIGYIFPCTGNDVRLSYSYFNNTTKDNLKSNHFNAALTPFEVSSGSDGILALETSANAKTKFKYQVADLETGQHIDLGCHAHVRAFAGLRYANLDSHLDANYFVLVNNLVNQNQGHMDVFTAQNSRFQGIGPRLGMDVNYDIGNGFGIAGEVGSALLVGDIHSNFSQRDITVTSTSTIEDVFSYKIPKENRVVPNLDAKLGINYSYQFCNPTRSKLTVEAGYLVDQYFNSMDRLTSLGAASPELRTRHTIDTSFSGPYIGVQVNL